MEHIDDRNEGGPDPRLKYHADEAGRARDDEERRAIDAFAVMEAGLWTTVQDLGRPGYQQFGVPGSGALDTYALEAANRLVGNRPDSAGLEVTLRGPRLRAVADAIVAVTGADLGFQINGRATPMWEVVRVRPGDELSFSAPRLGYRAYVAVAGGIAVPSVLGSRSTYVRGNIGGVDGRPLRSGDTLAAYPVEPGPLARVGLALPPELRRFAKPQPVRVIIGPQEDAFSPLAVERLLGVPYRVSPRSDRMGYRLEGLRLPYRDAVQHVSDGIAPGSIQVPADGRPIVLLADRQTTGGYPKIATVISADLDFLAQAWAGDRITFRRVSLAEAHSLRRERRALLDAVKRVTETGLEPLAG